MARQYAQVEKKRSHIVPGYQRSIVRVHHRGCATPLGSFEGHRNVGGPCDSGYWRYLDRRFSGLRCAFTANWYTKVCA